MAKPGHLAAHGLRRRAGVLELYEALGQEVAHRGDVAVRRHVGHAVVNEQRVALAHRACRALLAHVAVRHEHRGRFGLAFAVGEAQRDRGLGRGPGRAAAVVRQLRRVGDADRFGDDDLASESVDREARCDEHARPVRAEGDVQSADDAEADRQPVQAPSLLEEVALLELEVVDVEQLAVEVAVAHGSRQRRSRRIRQDRSGKRLPRYARSECHVHRRSSSRF